MPIAGSSEVDLLTSVIRIVDGKRVIFDVDLADLYGVPTARLNQQFRRNRGRFPPDFAFEVAAEAAMNLMLQNATSSRSHGGRRKSAIASRRGLKRPA